MAQNNKDFTEKECQAAMKYLFQKRNLAKKKLVTLGDKLPFYSTVKKWVARFGTGHLSTDDEKHSATPTQVTFSENVDVIHSMILDDQRISTKKDNRDPGDIPKKNRPYFSQDFRHEKALTQKSSQMSQVMIRSIIKCFLHKPFWTISARSYGIFNRIIAMDKTYVYI
jgi:hypothetical protein